MGSVRVTTWSITLSQNLKSEDQDTHQDPLESNLTAGV